MLMGASGKAALLIRLLFILLFRNKRNAAPAVLAERSLVIPCYCRFGYPDVTFSQPKVQAIAPQRFAEKYAAPGSLYISRAHFPAAVRTFHILSPYLVHENLASLRFSVSLWFYIFNLSRKQNHVFVQRNPICKYFCLREEGEFFAFYNMGALKKAKKREKMPLKTRKRLNGGVALKSQKFAGNSLPRISRVFFYFPFFSLPKATNSRCLSRSIRRIMLSSSSSPQMLLRPAAYSASISSFILTTSASFLSILCSSGR